MSVNLSIKDVPEELAQRLRERAARNHRSLQGELMAIVSAAAGAGPVSDGLGGAAASPLRRGVEMRGWKSVEMLLAERRANPLGAARGVADGIPLAVDIIRADRDSR